ncbi:uroporphyrinogen-III C-methyltransferase [Azohydromonas australica]|uniref:uroporphyrinogen-III C-methyltransferase n=1 Tax=Azohydromonas australica TaxID=364039 RepID=UPI000411FCB0|nr:uroporphyrinogen-III C-methyltransferase [Azohydromonas australica]
MSVLDEPLYFGPVPSVASAPRAARVTLVGAGPGDPELLTVRAERALRRASLVLYDHLVSRDVLRLVPEGADLIYVGKESAHHTLPQEDICTLMIRLARSGRALVRLKGGDPFIFGRGGEEAQALAAVGVPFEVVPGISAAQAAAAEAGMPLTHRDHAASVVLATGHRRSEAGVLDMDWAALARPRQTVVIYMGVSTLPSICAQLTAHGLPADTPAALVERASQPDSRRVVGTLQTLPGLATLHSVRAPALLIVGGVVTLHAALAAPGCGLAAQVGG